MPTDNDSPVIAVYQSQNRKLGFASATYVTQATCPAGCPFRRNGCYAERGHVGWIVAPRVNGSSVTDPDLVAQVEAAAIDTLPADRDLRLHVVGDCPTTFAASEVAAAARRFVARGRLLRRVLFGPKSRPPAVWTYTHAWSVVPKSAWRGVSVLASCETDAQAHAAIDRGYRVALSVPDFPPGGKRFKVGELTVIPCQEQVRGVPCTSCRLCLDADRLPADTAIGFAPTGDRATKARFRKALEVVNLPEAS